MEEEELPGYSRKRETEGAIPPPQYSGEQRPLSHKQSPFLQVNTIRRKAGRKENSEERISSLPDIRISYAHTDQSHNQGREQYLIRSEVRLCRPQRPKRVCLLEIRIFVSSGK